MKWNVRAGRATGNKEESNELNGYLDTLTAKVYQAKKTLLDADKEVTADAIKNILLGKTQDQKTILEVFQEHNDQVVALLGTDFAAGTLERDTRPPLITPGILLNGSIGSMILRLKSWTMNSSHNMNFGSNLSVSVLTIQR